MITYRIPPERWTTLLRPLLDPGSLAHTLSLPIAIRSNFDQLYEELNIFNRVIQEYHRIQWASLKAVPGEQYIQTAVRVETAMNTWSRHCKTADEVRDLVATDRFLRLIDKDWTRTLL